MRGEGGFHLIREILLLGGSLLASLLASLFATLLGSGLLHLLGGGLLGDLLGDLGSGSSSSSDFAGYRE